MIKVYFLHVLKVHNKTHLNFLKVKKWRKDWGRRNKKEWWVWSEYILRSMDTSRWNPSFCTINICWKKKRNLTTLEGRK
jgi:hypothetical protein